MSERNPLHLIVTGSASHTPALFEEMQTVAARLGERLGATETAAAWFDQGRPTLPDALVAAAKGGAHRVLVVPYLLQWSYPDQFVLPSHIATFIETYPFVQVHLAQPIGLSGAVEDALVDRARHALEAPDFATLSDEDVRSFALQDPAAVRAETPPPAPVVRHHLLVCNGRPCLDAGGTELDVALRAAVSASGLSNGPERVQVTRTRCLGPCRGAAVVLAYPEGAWFHGVEPGQAASLLDTVTGRSDTLRAQQFTHKQ